MRPKSIALLLMALGCGLVASIGITEVMSRRALPDNMLGDTLPIFVAVSDVPIGEPLMPDQIKLEPWPKDKVPPGALTKLEDVEGRRPRTKIYAGEPVLEHRLLGKGASEQGSSALIPKGYRVVPVKVDLVSGGSSMILPGDRVDVMVHSVRDPTREIPETVTQTILQDIKVFAVDDVVDLEKDKDNNRKSIVAKTISLLVTPEQAALVMLATQMGSINLVMRSPEDDEQTANAQARPGQLFAPGGKTDRGNETLMQQEDPSLQGKANGFVQFLNTMKQKSPPQVQAAVDPESQHPTWTMRVLKPGEVNEVQFEQRGDSAGSDVASASQWQKSNATAPAISTTDSATTTDSESKTSTAGEEQKTPPPPLKDAD